MLHARCSQLIPQREQQVLRQRGHAVLAALAVTDHQCAPLRFHVFRPQAQILQQAHAGAIQQRGHQTHRATHLVQQCPHLGGCHHDRELAVAARGDDFIQPG